MVENIESEKAVGRPIVSKWQRNCAILISLVSVKMSCQKTTRWYVSRKITHFDLHHNYRSFKKQPYILLEQTEMSVNLKLISQGSIPKYGKFFEKMLIIYKHISSQKWKQHWKDDYIYSLDYFAVVMTKVH